MKSRMGFSLIELMIVVAFILVSVITNPNYDEHVQECLRGRHASGSMPLPQLQKYYYRITTRIAGPRNTVSYIQIIVAR